MELLTTKKGFAVVEILLAITFFALFSVGVFYLSVDTLRWNSKNELSNQATLYAQEGLEAARNMRDRNFLYITDGDHGLSFANDTWSFIPAPENIDNFYNRTINVEDVYRDQQGNIATEGLYDPDTKKITSSVDWTDGVVPRSASLTTYFSNWRGDDSIITTCDEFNGGTYDNTENIAAPGPPNDNCSIKLKVNEAQSSFYKSADIGDQGNDVTVSGNYAYVANNKTNTGFTVVNVTDRNNPVIVKNLDIGGRGRRITKEGNYIYIGVGKDSKGLAIINVIDPNNPSITSTLNVGNYGDNVSVSGNYLYMGVEKNTNSFNIINISNKSNPVITSQLSYNGIVQALAIQGNYAYLGLSNDLESFKVVDISNPNAPVKISSLNVGEEINSITISGHYAFVGIEDTAKSLKIVDISNPASPRVVAFLNVNGEIQSLVISGNYLYGAINEVSTGLAAINIENPLAPYLIYNLDLSGKGTGIAVDGSYVYVTLNTSNKGLVIVGTIVVNTSITGTYTSDIFDTGSTTTRYDIIEWQQTAIPGGSIKFQIRTADSAVNIASATWVGSDGTNNSFYENSRTAIALDLNRTGNQYFQYKTIMSSDGVNSPILESIKVNYIP